MSGSGRSMCSQRTVRIMLLSVARRYVIQYESGEVAQGQGPLSLAEVVVLPRRPLDPAEEKWRGG